MTYEFYIVDCLTKEAGLWGEPTEKILLFTTTMKEGYLYLLPHLTISVCLSNISDFAAVLELWIGEE